jgi:hypothetical protein
MQYEGNHSEVGAHHCNSIVIEILMMGNHPARRGMCRLDYQAAQAAW